MPIEEQAQMAESFVNGVVERLGLAASTSITVADESVIEVAVNGEELGLLIGPHGSTLTALQELTRTVVQRRGTDHGTRIVVDVSGYRAKRAAALSQFARSVALEVLSSGTAHALEPMSASDRKIVHDTVNAMEGVATSSEGEESGRHVIIRPDSAGGAHAAASEEAAEPSGDEPGDDDSAVQPPAGELAAE